MKHRVSIQLLLTVSLFLIILGQDLQNWEEFSSIRQWLTGTLIVIWLVHLLLTITILYKKFQQKHNYN
ncbi:hypothetical protein [Virgibacillus sediminis]|uniref:DUF3955 domain-containing protein n=1 Tax=Virgibacillus sediminis TaxID=202260 RepID=A0ABV7A1J2_9BACI